MSNSGPSPATTGRRKVTFYVAVLVVGALIGGLVGLGVALLLPRGWSATTSVLVTPLEGNPYNPSTQGTTLTNLETEAAVAGSEVIGSEVVSELGLDTSALGLGRDVDVTLESNTQVVKITYTSSKKSLVAPVSDAYAKAFLAHRTSERDDAVEAAQTTINDRIQAITRRLNAVPVQTGTGQKRQALGGQLLNLRVQAASIAASTGSPGEIIVTATPQRSGLALAPWACIAVGVLVGLLLALLYTVSGARRHNALGGR